MRKLKIQLQINAISNQTGIKLLYGLVPVSTGVLKFGKPSAALGTALTT